MRQGWCSLVFAVLAAAIGGGEGAAQGLGQPLEMQITQSGFAGETGRVWTVRPDGTWTVRRLGPGAPEAPTATGSLTEAQIAELRRLLDRNDFQALPNSLGEPVDVNPHRLTIRWGRREVVLMTPPGDNPLVKLPQASVPQTPEQRVVAIARDVQKLTTE
jgi:hypothetical protein